MTHLRFSNLFSTVALGAFAAMATPASAITINLDGSTTAVLSDAVAAAYANEDGPDVINISVNSLATSDGVQIYLTAPITINGDGENNGAGDGIPCDILVDVAKMKEEATTGTLPQVGDGRTAYIEIASEGAVNISDLNIHPNESGTFGRAGTIRAQQMVGGIRMNKPVSGEGTYNLTRVNVSGSDENNAFVSLASGEDLYNMSGVKKWGGHNGLPSSGSTPVNNVDGTVADFCAIIAANNANVGVYNSILDHCHAGLTFGMALTLEADSGTHQVLGGVYGHSARDGIRIAGTTATITGTHDDRVRVVRAANISGDNSHSIEVTSANANIALLEYIDVAGLTTANGLNIRGGNIGIIRFFRSLGKFDRANARNEAIFITSANTFIESITDITSFSNGQLVANGVNPLSITSAVADAIEIKDSIFASDTSGTVTIEAPAVTFGFCALPNDGFTSESLATVPVTGAGAPDPLPASTVLESPHFALTMDDYDWSDNQGAGQPGNAAGNVNVLRPTNPAYENASSTGGRLNGGAGAPAAGIDPSEWMLMQ